MNKLDRINCIYKTFLAFAIDTYLNIYLTVVMTIQKYLNFTTLAYAKFLGEINDYLYYLWQFFLADIAIYCDLYRGLVNYYKVQSFIPGEEVIWL